MDIGKFYPPIFTPLCFMSYSAHARGCIYTHFRGAHSHSGTLGVLKLDNLVHIAGLLICPSLHNLRCLNICVARTLFSRFFNRKRSTFFPRPRKSHAAPWKVAVAARSCCDFPYRPRGRATFLRPAQHWFKLPHTHLLRLSNI